MKRIGDRIWPSNTELRQYEEVIQQYTRCQSKAKGDLLSDVLIYTFNESFFISVLLQIDIGQAPVVQRLDNAIHRINHYPADKC